MNACKTNAQEQQYTFNNLNEKDGLKNNIVFSLLKDSHGILWIGTQNGLNRFDGSHFYTFKKTKDPASLPNNTINSLCEDKNGDIWGGTVNGIFCYSPMQNKFTTYYAPKEANDNIISNILCDNKGEIYAATSVALLKFDQSKKSFLILDKVIDSKDSVGWYTMGKNRMLKDEKNDGLWITTRAGLLFYDIQRHKLFSAMNCPDLLLFARRNTGALAKSPKGYFWFCDNDTKELVAFDPKSKTILQTISIKKEAPQANGATILEDSQNRLWFSSWSYDLLNIDLGNHNKIGRIQSKEGSNNTVAGDFFWAAIEDENGTIWLGTINGLSMCNPGKYVFKACRLPDKIPLLKSCAIYLTEEDPKDKSWWIVTTTRTVIHYFPATEKSVVYDLGKSIPDKKGQTPKSIFHLRFLEGSVLITCSNGAWQLKPTSQRFVPFNILPISYADFVITDLILADSIIYFTNGNTLISWNKNTRLDTELKFDTAQLKNNNGLDFSHLLWKPNQTFYWAANNNCIGSVSPQNQLKLIKLIKNDTLEAGGYFHCTDMDNQGNVWVCNKGVGLYRYDPRTKEIKYWTELDGMVDNNLHSIKADNQGNIWALYFNKASVYNPAKNSFVNFTIPYSENNLNYYNNLTKRADGVIMGNVNNDVFEFHSGNLNLVPKKTAPVLSVINISGKDYFLTTEDELQLNPDENSIRVKFGFLTDALLYPHEFEYKLEGSDKQWVRSSTANEANYNNLPPGNYTFRLIAKGRNNAWQSAEKIIRLKINAPFYKTSWFTLLLLFIITSGIFILYRYRLLQKEKLFVLEGKAQLLEKEKTMVMYESLKQQLNPHFLFNSLTNLSGLIETDQAMAGEFLEQMSGIYRYILKNANHETVTIKDEIEFVKLYVSLQQTRFKKGLLVNIHIPDGFMHFKIAPVTLQNLIENAIKHNVIDAGTPLVIDIFIEDGYIVVKNNLHKKNRVETSNKKGLAQFVTLYKYLSEKPIVIKETDSIFLIKIPLI